MSRRRDQQTPGQHGRTDPRLGDLNYLEPDRAAPTEPPLRDNLPPLSIDPSDRRGGRGAGRPSGTAQALPPAAPRRRGWIVPLLLLLVIAVGTAAWLNQDQLRGMVPSTELNDVLSRADQALHDGRLDGDQGTSARELYEAARALQPDNDRARDGLHNVGMADIAQADASLQAGKLDQAGQQLSSARELLGGGSDVDRLTQAIAQARGSQVQAGSLVDQAQAALDAGRFDEAGGAYRQILAADPSNAVASHGLDKVGDALSAQAHKALDGNDLVGATATVGKLAALLPNYGELPALRAALAQAQHNSDDALAGLLKQGEDAMRDGRFSGSDHDDALWYFQSALQQDPDNAEAKAGLGQVAQALIVQASAAIDANDTVQAGKLLDQAATLAPKSADLAAAQAHLAEIARQAQDPVAAPVALTPAQTAQVASLLNQAHAAAQHGDIMSPPGQCAYDLYRSALAIDGDNAAALQGLQQLPNLVSAQFERALAGGNLAQAGDLLGSLSDLSPGDAGQDQLRLRLSNAWLDQSARLLAEGDHNGAMQAWVQARKLSPANPRLPDLGGQLDPGH